MTLWYKKLGFHNNPFSIKPAAFQSEMVAYDLDYIFEKVDNAEMVFIEGLYGSGKTTILKSIINNFRGKNRIIYFSFNNGRNFDTQALLKGANTFFKRLAGLEVSDVIMLLDEVNGMTKSHAKDVFNFYQEGIVQSIVFVDKEYKKKNFPKEISTFLNGNVIRTVHLNQDEAIELVNSRLGDIDLFTNKIIKQIFNLADKNPRRFLAYCEDVARYAVEMDDFKVSDFHIETVLEDVIKEKKVKKVKKVSKIEEPKPERQKKFKVNKLVEGKKEKLGMVEATKEIIEPVLEIKEKEDVSEITNDESDMENTPEKVEVAEPDLDTQKDIAESVTAELQASQEPVIEDLETEPQDKSEPVEAEVEEKPKSANEDETIPEYKVFVFDD